MVVPRGRARPVRATRIAIALMLAAVAAQTLPAIGYPEPGHHSGATQQALHAPFTPRPTEEASTPHAAEPRPQTSSPSPTHGKPLQGP